MHRFVDINLHACMYMFKMDISKMFFKIIIAYVYKFLIFLIYKMEPLKRCPSRREYFQISVDLKKGKTVMTGTDLGKQFVFEVLSKIVNVNAAFLNYCRQNVMQGMYFFILKVLFC